ncbi:phosphotransferase [Flavitalea sp. BT771]|uniref:phosphotransferase enzyme family protein n=1 Tax=Flavitalea sp. BT771 TaxID=3063329 RepID=UPI0026E459C2|nr:phosphotransferase [Flavitalea sp. BT771]MDO6429115.1 phosphotransferase [Flavitalea sp. BT771]MDV6218757.1 phosphotransferase [Flavitalea sp. BT771]
MNIFPTQYSTLSAPALKDHLEKQYGFKHMRCRLLVRNVSDTYLLEGSDTKYIFKIYRDNYRKLDEIRAEVELLEVLKAGGARVAYAIADLQGRHIQSFQAAEGVRNGVLFYFAPGNVVMDPSDRQLTLIGREMAVMHNITAGLQLKHDRITYDFYTTLQRPLAVIRERFRELPDEYEFLQQVAEKVKKKLATFPTGSFSYGYCHYDLLVQNYHFDGQDGITFFDFDWCGKGWLANDLMTLYIHFFFHTHFGKVTQAEADRAFGIAVAGYRQVRPILDEEIEALPFLGVTFLIFALGFFEDNYDDFSITFLTPRYLRDRTALIKKLAEQYCKF